MAPPTLLAACSEGTVDQVKAVLDASPASSQDELDAALEHATWRGDVEIVGLLLSRGARLKEISFIGATRTRNPALFEEFLKHGWDINSTEFGSPALRLVVDDETCVKWLLDHGADPNVPGERGATPLATAALRPSIAVLELLLAYGAELDARALYNAIDRRGQGGIPVMRFLLDRGVDVNAPSRQWCTPLHYAVRGADKERIQLLLDRGADTTIKGALGQTAAERAKSMGNMEIHDLILSRSG